MSQTTVFVYTLNQVGKIGAWSRYLFPFDIEAFAVKGESLFARSGDEVLELSEEFGLVDYAGRAEEEGGELPFDGVIQWPWLDMGQPGRDSTMDGFDIVGVGTPTVEVGYAQETNNAPAYFTDPYEVAPDTLTDAGYIGLQVTAPTMSLRITYKGASGARAWEFQELLVHLL